MSDEQRLEVLRLVQLALLQKVRNADSERIGKALLQTFPCGRTAVDAETARILAALDVEGAAAKIMPLVEKAQTNGEQLHYALVLRYLDVGWNGPLATRLMDWYETTRGWEGGHSLTGYVSNIVGATSERFTPAERRDFILQWPKRPAGAALIVRSSEPQQIADFDRILTGLLDEEGRQPRAGEEDLIAAAIQSMGKSTSAGARALLRKLYEDHPDRREPIARGIAANPAPDDFPILIRTLSFADETTTQLCLAALRQLGRKPEKPDEYRAVIQSGLKLGAGGGLAAVRLLRGWTKADHGAGRDAAKALAFYQKWYSDTFPNAPAAELPREEAAKSKYSYQQLADYLEHDGRGNADRGRQAFTKAKCLKCHRFLNEGESVGPDLTSVRRRFQRKEIVESVVYPSQVISDQYRMVQITTTEGLVHVGMPVPGATAGGKLVLLLSDATKIEIPKDRVEEQAASKISVMPAGLLDPLSLEEIGDLFAFLETSKFNAPATNAASTAVSGSLPPAATPPGPGSTRGPSSATGSSGRASSGGTSAK
jgi:putative heme-binding domain-containing protein